MKFKSNLDQIAALQPDYLGFIFYKGSERFVKDSLKPSDLENIHAKKVGVFVNQSIEEIENAISFFNLNAVQLHGNETPNICSHFLNKGVVVIKAFSIDNNFNFEITDAYIHSCNYFLFDTKGKKPGGTGISFNRNILKKYNGSTPFFLSGGIGLENLDGISELKNLYGVDFNSKLEDGPGMKNIQKAKQAISLIRKIQ